MTIIICCSRMSLRAGCLRKFPSRRWSRVNDWLANSHDLNWLENVSTSEPSKRFGWVCKICYWDMECFKPVRLKWWHHLVLLTVQFLLVPCLRSLILWIFLIKTQKYSNNNNNNNAWKIMSDNFSAINHRYQSQCFWLSTTPGCIFRPIVTKIIQISQKLGAGLSTLSVLLETSRAEFLV